MPQIIAAVAGLSVSASAGRFEPVGSGLAPDWLVWTDTCNVYVLRDGDAALLIDLGDGSVLDHLGDIGVKRVEWILFTHHHREQCQGAARLKEIDAVIVTHMHGDHFLLFACSFCSAPPQAALRLGQFGRETANPPCHPERRTCLAVPEIPRLRSAALGMTGGA